MIRFLEVCFARVHRHPWRWLAFALLVTTSIALLGPYAQLTERYGEHALFDMYPTFDTTVAQLRLAGFGAQGGELYRVGLALDCLFALANGLLLLIVLRPLRTAPSQRRVWVFTIVALAMGADWFENGCICALLELGVSESIVLATGLATWTKQLAFMGALGVALVLWLGKGWQRVREPGQGNWHRVIS